MVQTSRVLRLPALAVVLALAYLAQYIFDFGSLQSLYPAWVLERFPFLQRTTLWLAEDLYTLGLWLMAGCAVVFGLLVPGWEEQPAAMGPAGSDQRALAADGGVPVSGRPPWIWLGLLLAVTALAVGWGWTNLPVRVDPQVAASGLQAQALLAGTGRGWLAPGATGAPQVAYFPAALAALALGSGPGGTHLVGLLAALATVAATYLLAGELFWIAPHRRGLALLAAGFTAAAVPLFHFGRLAPYLPATAAGVLAAWALLAGQRKANLPLIAASGGLAAGALWLDRSGLLFVLLLLLWWLGLGLGLGLQKRFSWRLLALWLAACLILAAPLLIAWMLTPSAWQAYLQGGPDQGVLSDWWTNLRAALATLFWTPDASSIFGYDGHFVQSAVAPLFFLGAGALLLNLDRLIGWCLLTWLGCALLLAGALSPVAPYWPLLLPLLPVAGITVVFALDRMAALWAQTSREDGSTAAASLAAGLLIAVAALSWISYYEFAAVGGDPASYTGRAMATLPRSAVAVLVSSRPDGAVRLDDPVLRFVAGPRVNQALSVGIDALPATLPPASQVIVQGTDATALSAARARYPSATVTVVRDGQSNPRLFVLQMP